MGERLTKPDIFDMMNDAKAAELLGQCNEVLDDLLAADVEGYAPLPIMKLDMGEVRRKAEEMESKRQFAGMRPMGNA